ncbi:TM0106 family RecB-like putative nuclease [Patulibacter brassicae]|uniref:TM0106 family RecB-like putative nuclease n=1 Tax=Patulibacter brassicae TaxID=1705717 RepID=A0ABU4VJQ9_9ACTN|nr:TM0106 family RecB-like putative nuclease [Patulibacter brassicae]MDX8152081.1 TM0106 family RecB-like putative nuclease [Patulibacter brassicae]
MFLLGQRLITSPTDLAAASACEWSYARRIDERLERIDAFGTETDAMGRRAGELGDVHEHRILERYRERFGAGVVEIPSPFVQGEEELAAAVRSTVAALTNPATQVVFQATFAPAPPAEPFLGFADFLVRGDDERWVVQDSKLARSAKVSALLQLAAYVDQLDLLGIPVSDTVELLLGNGEVSRHHIDDIRPVFRRRWARLREIGDLVLARETATAWRDQDLRACGRCDRCAAEAAVNRDVVLVAGLRTTQRDRLADAEIETIDQLAASTGPVEGIGARTLENLRRQARLQVAASAEAPPPFEIVDPQALAALPAPSPGDLFFDFEGDPLYEAGDGTTWGIDYLFGVSDTEDEFRAWWAHDLGEERQALRAFLDFVAECRARHPDLRIYHYAAYEQTHLASLAARHGVGEDEVDDLLRSHVLVDLYSVVRKALRVGSPSYSIKKLEPLYMTEARDGEGVTTAADSVEEYANARLLRDDGDLEGWRRKLAELEDYNRYDCRSTRHLRDWLLDQAGRSGVPVEAPVVDADDPEPGKDDAPAPLVAELRQVAGLADADAQPVPADEQQRVAALGAAALDFHRREAKAFWWEHFRRVSAPIDDWADTRDVLIVDPAASEVVRDWHKEGRQRKLRRHVRLRGTWAPGSRPAPTSRTGPYVLYDQPAPVPAISSAPTDRAELAVKVLEVDGDGAVLVEEIAPGDPYAILPVALTPARPPKPGELPGAIGEWANRFLDAVPGWPDDAATDVLRRRPPRTRSGSLRAVVDGDFIDALTGSLLDLDESYVAVQGPPGSGKTYVGAHVIARLVRDHGWKVGVVAQSHAVVENLLTKLVTDAGLPAALVGKERKQDAEAAPVAFTALASGKQPEFAQRHRATGFVLGGTAWTFANPKRVERAELDLLVIDEAGQFSLAATMASSVAARNLLLLGDPQQLPQVSQVTHPAPVDRSALAWIADGSDVLPAEFGYFLDRTWRMPPELTAPVSRLSYGGALLAHPQQQHRRLHGVDPGLHVLPVEHHGYAQHSPEEATAVTDLVGDLLGRTWECGEEIRPLAPKDVIVITPYNAQRVTVLEALTAVGIEGVRVGTVDAFQGQEAAVSIVTLAASSAAEVPRGLSFLILRNRLNVAISRATWASWLVHSPGLADHLPARPEGVAELSAFLTLVEGTRPVSSAVAAGRAGRNS